MELKAKVIQSLGIQSGTSKAGNAWSKAEIIVEYGDKYPKKVKLSHMKRVEEFAALPVDSEVTFQIDLESREFNGRWYTEANCFAWSQNTSSSTEAFATPDISTTPPPSAYQQAQSLYNPTQSEQQTAPPSGGDDLPF